MEVLMCLHIRMRVERTDGAGLTNDAEDTQNVRSKNHQHVDESEQNESNGNVTQPVESLGGKQHLLDGSSYLRAQTNGPTKMQ